MKSVFKFFTLAIKFYCLFLVIFSSFFFLICVLYFWQISSPSAYVSKNALNHFLVYFSAKNSLKSAKNVVFFILRLGWQANRGAIAPPPAPWLHHCLGLMFLCSWPRLMLTFYKPIMSLKKSLALCRLYRWKVQVVNFANSALSNQSDP